MAAILAGGAKMAGGVPVAGRRRCGARSKREPGNFCARYVAPGKTRCNLHGGKSTGPRNPARLTPERLAAMHEGRRRWARGLKATGQRSPCGGDFTKSAKEKAERARLHKNLARKVNEAMFRANPELIAKASCRLAEATMRLAEATHLEKLEKPFDTFGSGQGRGFSENGGVSAGLPELQERIGMAAGSVPERYLDTWAWLQCQRPWGVTEARWRQAIDDAGKFLDQLGQSFVKLYFSLALRRPALCMSAWLSTAAMTFETVSSIVSNCNRISANSSSVRPRYLPKCWSVEATCVSIEPIRLSSSVTC
jgi:hypothetical protein